MRVDPLGEKAWIISGFDGTPAYVLADALRDLGAPEIVDAVPSYNTVGLYTDRYDLNEERIRTLLEEAKRIDARPARTHTIPVCYELGQDIAEVAGGLNLSVDAVIGAHMSATYRCYALGFCPGFPYLGYLPEELSAVGRRPSPRTRVEPGTVAIAKGQTGIYPLPRPGGWWLIGQTPLAIVDVADDYFPIRAGDEVQFVRIDESQYTQLKGERL